MTLPVAPIHPIHGEGQQLWNGRTKVTKPTNNAIYACIQDPVTQYYWRRKGFVSNTADLLIPCKVLAEAYRSLPQHEKQWVTKTASQNCGVGTTFVEWDMQDDAKCPRCGRGHDQETTEHVTQCRTQGADTRFKKSLCQICSYLNKTNTWPVLTDTILHCLRHWHQRNQ
jgi:hypothetical protein